MEKDLAGEWGWLWIVCRDGPHVCRMCRNICHQPAGLLLSCYYAPSELPRPLRQTEDLPNDHFVVATARAWLARNAMSLPQQPWSSSRGWRGNGQVNHNFYIFLQPLKLGGPRGCGTVGFPNHGDAKPWGHQVPVPTWGGQLDPAICAKWHLPNEHAQICLSAHPSVSPFSDAASGCTRQSKNLFTAGSPQPFQAVKSWMFKIPLLVSSHILDRTTPIQYPNKK